MAKILHVSVVKATLVSDQGITYSPYATAQFGRLSARTRVVDKSLSPVWRHYCMFEVAEKETQLPLVITIHSHKIMKDRFVGFALIEDIGEDIPEEGKWFQLAGQGAYEHFLQQQQQQLQLQAQEEQASSPSSGSPSSLSSGSNGSSVSSGSSGSSGGAFGFLKSKMKLSSGSSSGSSPSSQPGSAASSASSSPEHGPFEPYAEAVKRDVIRGQVLLQLRLEDAPVNPRSSPASSPGPKGRARTSSFSPLPKLREGEGSVQQQREEGEAERIGYPEGSRRGTLAEELEDADVNGDLALRAEDEDVANHVEARRRGRSRSRRRSLSFSTNQPPEEARRAGTPFHQLAARLRRPSDAGFPAAQVAEDALVSPDLASSSGEGDELAQPLARKLRKHKGRRHAALRKQNQELELRQRRLDEQQRELEERRLRLETLGNEASELQEGSPSSPKSSLPSPVASSSSSAVSSSSVVGVGNSNPSSSSSSSAPAAPASSASEKVTKTKTLSSLFASLKASASSSSPSKPSAAASAAAAASQQENEPKFRYYASLDGKGSLGIGIKPAPPPGVGAVIEKLKEEGQAASWNLSVTRNHEEDALSVDMELPVLKVGDRVIELEGDPVGEEGYPQVLARLRALTRAQAPFTLRLERSGPALLRSASASRNAAADSASEEGFSRAGVVSESDAELFRGVSCGEEEVISSEDLGSGEVEEEEAVEENSTVSSPKSVILPGSPTSSQNEAGVEESEPPVSDSVAAVVASSVTPASEPAPIVAPAVAPVVAPVVAPPVVVVEYRADPAVQLRLEHQLQESRRLAAGLQKEQARAEQLERERAELRLRNSELAEGSRILGDEAEELRAQLANHPRVLQLEEENAGWKRRGADLQQALDSARSQLEHLQTRMRLLEEKHVAKMCELNELENAKALQEAGFEHRLRKTFGLAESELLLNLHSCTSGMLYIFQEHLCIDLFPNKQRPNNERLRFPIVAIVQLEKRNSLLHVEDGLTIVLARNKGQLRLDGLADRRAFVMDLAAVAGGLKHLINIV